MLQDQWELVVLGPVVVTDAWVYFDQPEHCYLQDLELDFGFELQDLELDFELQVLELDFELQVLSLILTCQTLSLICGTLYCIHKLTLSTRISWIRGIWSIHLFSDLLPNQNLSECLTHLDFALFLSLDIRHISFFSTGKIYLTDITKISQIQYYYRSLMVKNHNHIRLLSLLFISLLCQNS